MIENYIYQELIINSKNKPHANPRQWTPAPLRLSNRLSTIIIITIIIIITPLINFPTLTNTLRGLQQKRHIYSCFLFILIYFSFPYQKPADERPTLGLCCASRHTHQVVLLLFFVLILFFLFCFSEPKPQVRCSDGEGSDALAGNLVHLFIYLKKINLLIY